MADVPILRTSERRDFLRCQQRWWWAWREGLRPRGPEEADALWFGTGIHLALALWYCGPGTKRGPHPAETWVKYAEDSIRTLKFDVPFVNPNTNMEETEARWEDATTLGRVMMEEYVHLYGRDEQKLIISPEQTFDLDVPWPIDYANIAELLGWKPFRDPRQGEGIGLQPNDLPQLLKYVGTFDSAFRDADTGWLLLDEHKTAKAISLDHLPLDPQAGSYWAVATRTLRARGLIGPKEWLRGIEYNFMRKAMPDERPTDAEGYACNKPEKKHYHEALDKAEVAWSPKMRLSDLEELAALARVRVLGDRSKVQPAANFVRHREYRTRNEMKTQLVRMQQEGVMMAATRGGLLPVLKNPDRTCNMGAFRCQFYEMCELHEKGGDWEGYKKAVFNVQDPYADHRLR